eukprot:gene194-gene1334
MRPIAFGATCATGGILFGVTQHNNLNIALARVFWNSGPGRVDRCDATSILMEATRIAYATPAQCAMLSTNRESDSPACRPILLKEPFGVSCDGDDIVIVFNTNRLSRKVAEIRSDPRASFTFWDPNRLAYATFAGVVQQIAEPEAKLLFRPFMNLFYPNGSSGVYTAWKMQCNSVQLVVIGNLESTRIDWRPAEIQQLSPSGPWNVVCDG